jgi:L-threonylcarbamoyladenylate synthase
VIARQGFADDEVLELARRALSAGEVVAIPTDTVYGLAVDPRVEGATSALFEVKGRPQTVEIPVLVAGIEQADHLALGGLRGAARRIAESFWPGPVTLVVQRRPELGWDLGGDGSTIGIRAPGHAVALRLCSCVGPLATTSANLHGTAPLTDAESVTRTFGERIALVVDAGTCDGVPSTVVDVTRGKVEVLREGGIPAEEIEQVTA